MPLNSEVLRNIDGLVRGGFDERDRIIEIFCEEMHESSTKLKLRSR